jgi:hypothetical protein
VSLSIAATAFGPEKLYRNFGEAADSDDKDLYAAIWKLTNQTKAPVQDLHGGNHL